MKKILISFLVFFVFFSCKDGNKKKPDTITIGTVLSLTKESKLWGKNTLKGANLAVEEINKNGGILGKELILDDSGDSESNPKGAVSAMQYMLSKNSIQCIIGDVMSSNTLAIAPIAEKNKKVLLNFCVAIELSNAGDYIFRNWNSALSDAESTAKIAKKLSKKIVILYQNDSYGTSLQAEFVKQMKENNIEIVFTSAFDRNSLDFRSLITNIKQKDYDGIFLASYFSEALSFIKQYNEMDAKKVPLYGTSEWESKNLIDYIKVNYSDLAYYGYPLPPDSTSKVRKSFIENYKKKYNEEPGILCDNGYDAIYQLKYGIEKAKEYDATKIKDALYTLKDFKGASGTMSFDKNGDVHKPFGTRIITKKGTEWYEK